MNKAGGRDGIPVELFQILKDLPSNVENSTVATRLEIVFIPVLKKGNAKERSN